MIKFQVAREDGKKGSQKKIEWGEVDKKALETDISFNFMFEPALC